MKRRPLATLRVERNPERDKMGLTPPSQLAFFLAVLLAICALLVHYAHVAIPVVNTHSFETLLVGFLILLAGVLFRGF